MFCEFHSRGCTRNHHFPYVTDHSPFLNGFLNGLLPQRILDSSLSLSPLFNYTITSSLPDQQRSSNASHARRQESTERRVAVPPACRAWAGSDTRFITFAKANRRDSLRRQRKPRRVSRHFPPLSRLARKGHQLDARTRGREFTRYWVISGSL